MIKTTREITKSKIRPPKTGTPVLVRLQDELLEQLDDWRSAQRPIPTRAEAIRQHLEQALDGAGRARRK
jgi:metal-responsive CopG/Arc/MetJ family transcriptional regulator